ncbi:SIR2 family protein [Flavobacterium sp. DGU11]|uniref:SIR2 family protein n=1 Tax=Flavobacterium arundinis TaxID=3139143 RepID=A0ABU9HX03_9FLAO
MKEIKIEHLAYLLKQAKQNNQPQPIFFLGAGASCTGNIPLAGEIIDKILEDYTDSPFIKNLSLEERTYAKLMNCLLPAQRDELLKGYIRNAKINVTHIYLAQLLRENFVDYVLTVNFDNLMLRALALYNIFPATYDMAILKDLTTTTFKEKSVVYLHGQNHGLWLLNTQEELNKVKNIAPRIFDSIKNGRPWVFIGYSGEDPIFDHIRRLGRFDNGLFWVSYNNHNPKENVQDFLSKPNTNAFLIKGYDSDSFMFKLCSELDLSQVDIISNPFTALEEMLDNIVDIDDKEHFKGANERLKISKEEVGKAKLQFEIRKVGSKDFEHSQVDLLKKEIINLIVTENYNGTHITDIENQAKGIDDLSVKNLLSDLYFNWGNYLADIADAEKAEQKIALFGEIFKKFQKAIEIKPNYEEAWYNWGICIANLAEITEGKEKDELFNQAFEKYQKAIKIKADYKDAWFSWASDLGSFAETKEGEEKENLLHQAFEKYQKAIEIKPHYKTWFNWATDLGNLADVKKGKEREELFHQAFEKYQKSIEMKPKYKEAWNNWGADLANLALTRDGKEKEELVGQAFEKYRKAIELGGDCYNLSCLYSIQDNKESALHYLEASLERNEISSSFVEKDDDWAKFLDDSDFIAVLDKYR